MKGAATYRGIGKNAWTDKTKVAIANDESRFAIVQDLKLAEFALLSQRRFFGEEDIRNSKGEETSITRGFVE